MLICLLPSLVTGAVFPELEMEESGRDRAGWLVIQVHNAIYKPVVFHLKRFGLYTGLTLITALMFPLKVPLCAHVQIFTFQS